MKENKMLEFKQEINDKFLKTVSAFANYNNGQIIFGKDDNGIDKGIEDINKSCLRIENMINDSIKPRPDYAISVNKKRKIITLNVSKGLFAPYYYKNVAYKRNDTSTVPVDETELKRLILQGQNMNYESLPTRNQNLTFNYLGKEMKKAMKLKSFNTDIIKTLGLYDKSGQYNNAAEIVSDRNSFPGIDVARFGDSIDIIRERNNFENISIIEAFDSAEKIFEQHYSYEEISGINRQKKYTVPLKAFREALANAIIHREWDVNAKIRVMMFDDRIEVISPGGLLSGLSEKEYLEGQVSLLRNPILCGIFFRLNIIEQLGTGILRIKKEYMGFNSKPSFIIYDNSIKVTLPTENKAVVLTTDERIIYDYLCEGRLSSSGEISEAVKFGKNKTVDLLKSLVDKDAVYTVGKGRGTKYSIK